MAGHSTRRREDDRLRDKGKNMAKSGFIAAVKAGNLTSVRLLLNDSAVGVSSLERKTGLHCAAKIGLVDICRELVEVGTDIDCRDKEGLTPLHKAARGGRANVVEYLCSHGASVDALGAASLDTPLHVAAERGHLATCETLLRHGSRPALEAKDGLTACHKAAAKGHTSVCQLLVKQLGELLQTHLAEEPEQHEPLLFARSSSMQHTALHLGALHGHAAVCEALVALGFDRAATGTDKRTPLHLAAKAGCVEAIAPLVNSEALAARDADGATPLLLAAESGHTRVCEALVARGAHVDAPNARRATPLIKAAENGHLETVSSLLAHGAKATASDARRSTALMKAAMNGHLEICSALINASPALVLATDYCNASALHWAAGSGYKEVCLLLIRCGADPTRPDFKGQTPFHWAASRNHLSACRALVHNGAEDPMKRAKLQATLSPGQVSSPPTPGSPAKAPSATEWRLARAQARHDAKRAAQVVAAHSSPGSVVFERSSTVVLQQLAPVPDSGSMDGPDFQPPPLLELPSFSLPDIDPDAPATAQPHRKGRWSKVDKLRRSLARFLPPVGGARRGQAGKD